jgi:hypothetical protein
MNPVSILTVTAPSAGDFSWPHGLAGVPRAAVPKETSSGLMRLQPSLYDDTNVFMNASASGVTAFVFLW